MQQGKKVHSSALLRACHGGCLFQPSYAPPPHADPTNTHVCRRGSTTVAHSHTSVTVVAPVVAPVVPVAPMGGFGYGYGWGMPFGGFRIMPTFVMPFPFLGGMLSFMFLVSGASRAVLRTTTCGSWYGEAGAVLGATALHSGVVLLGVQPPYA